MNNRVRGHFKWVNTVDAQVQFTQVWVKWHKDVTVHVEIVCICIPEM